MIRCLSVFLSFMFIYLGACAQVVENTINLYGETLPAEKIHIHFDKEVYLPGETIWFKAYIFEENLPTTKSTNFYIALYDDKGNVLQQKVYPIISAGTDGSFDIPDSIRSNQVICRAYTNWLLNFDESYLYTHAIKLFNNSVTADTAKKTVSLHLFPEGGDMLESERNSIAFKANFNNGLPYNLAGVIKKQETGEVIDSIKSIHDGMGRFDIIQHPGERYYIEWLDNENKTQQTYLPVKKTDGVSLQVVQLKGKLIYNIVNHSSSDSLHLLGYMYQQVVCKAALPLPPGERFTGQVTMDSFPTGVLQLTVFDKNWQPVAERLCFINNGKFEVSPRINYKQINTQKRGMNSIEIIMPDTIPANMSLSITDADFNNEARTTNILTNLLLSSDIRGYVHNPSYYFTDNADDKIKEQLDLVMLTHGWRRYNWENMRTGILPEIKFRPDNYLSVYGQMSEELIKKIDKGEQVNLLVKTKDSTSRFYFVKPDAKGLLKATGLIFYDTAKIYYSLNTDKQYNKHMAFSTSNYTLVRSPFINNMYDHLVKDTSGTSFNATATLFKYYETKNKNAVPEKEKTMERVIVRNDSRQNWKNDPMLKMDEKYATGMFSGGATAYSFDLLHDEKSWERFDIYNYLTGKVPGLILAFPIQASRGGEKLGTDRYFVYLPKINMVGGSGGIPQQTNVLIYIDEREVETTQLETISLTQIAYVKFIPNFLGKGLEPGKDAIYPAISIYLKKGDDLIDRRAKITDLGMVKVPGYSPVKEFYVPDYSQSNDAIGNDSRTTLLWQPCIFTGKNYTTVPITFYNNDFSKRIKIVLEGTNDEGKLIHVEKIIE